MAPKTGFQSPGYLKSINRDSKKLRFSGVVYTENVLSYYLSYFNDPIISHSVHDEKDSSRYILCKETRTHVWLLAAAAANHHTHAYNKDYALARKCISTLSLQVVEYT